jgi:hypothetical protein
MTTATETINRQCSKCGGKGVIHAFAGIAGGVCFSCNGVGHHVTTAAAEKRRLAAKTRRDAKNASDAATRMEAFVTEYMTEAILSGMSAQECHDERCGCGGYCWDRHNGGVQGKRWAELTAALTGVA